MIMGLKEVRNFKSNTIRVFKCELGFHEIYMKVYICVYLPHTYIHVINTNQRRNNNSSNNRFNKARW